MRFVRAIGDCWICEWTFEWTLPRGGSYEVPMGTFRYFFFMDFYSRQSTHAVRDVPRVTQQVWQKITNLPLQFCIGSLVLTITTRLHGSFLFWPELIRYWNFHVLISISILYTQTCVASLFQQQAPCWAFLYRNQGQHDQPLDFLDCFEMKAQNKRSRIC